MAKKRGKAGPKTKGGVKGKGKPKVKPKVKPGFDPGGWPFWVVLVVLLSGPCIYGMFQITYDDASLMMRVGSGVVTAAIVAGVIAWAVDSLLMWRRKRIERLAKKQAKKRK